jgi:hypothetical protein
MNISTNYTSCPKCKNIFLKNFFKIHYEQCNRKEYQQLEIKKLMDRKEYERRNQYQAQQIIMREQERRNKEKIEIEEKKYQEMKAYEQEKINKNKQTKAREDATFRKFQQPFVSQAASHSEDKRDGDIQALLGAAENVTKFIEKQINSGVLIPDEEPLDLQKVVGAFERLYDKKEKEKNIDKPKKEYKQNEFISQQLEKYVPQNIVINNENMLIFFFKQYDKLFNEYLNGKSVSLVGPAQSIIGTGKGYMIDKFDLVVRLNKSIPLPKNLKEDIGSRTDIIYNSLNTSDYPGQNNLSPRVYKKYGVQFVCSSYPFNNAFFKQDILNYVNRYKFELPFKAMDDIKFNIFEKYLQTRPYTGTCAIMDLLSYPIKHLYITGLDFYQTKYYSEYRQISKEALKSTRSSIIHQAGPQLDYLKHVSLLDNRVILDNFLDKLLYGDYYKVVKNLYSYNSDNIFEFGDLYFKKYFEMRISQCTMTSNINNYNNAETQYPYLIFTNNKFFNKKDNEYAIFITNNQKDLEALNAALTNKRFIGNFYLTGRGGNNGDPSIYLNMKFIMHVKSILTKVGISNCNFNLFILLSLITYLPDKHYFSYNEIFNKWNLSLNEKKFVIFLNKKKILNLI